MSEKGPRLEYLQFLRRYLVRELARVDGWIAVEQRRTAEEAARRPPPEPPEWVIERGVSQHRTPLALHRGGCPMAQGMLRPVSETQARRALVDQGLRPCDVCRPDTALGVLE
ncbi:hypothetical protein HY68_01510 [Streptomyces sp. AcH 505]|uniref:DUF6233 domain-containing protein n=1 Tax=Streptomyces sp. AcH 505 TaxID=352211 RepID=UPI000591FE8D|nr:hypothetical protein HY68_01510 [Streptomyces sp. AcH 505]